MARSFWSLVLAALFWSSPSSPLAAHDDFASLLQAQSLTITVAELVANDSNAAVDRLSEVTLVIEDGPLHGDLEPTENGLAYQYQPDPSFIGVDRFRYSWMSPSGPIEAAVELLVSPWITPLAGPIGLLDPIADPAPKSVGYYNSKTGTFYFCPLPQALPPNGCLSCVAYHFPGFEPGWLPLLGSWRTTNDVLLLNRPGLYDPMTRQVYLLDLEDACPACAAAGATETLRVVEQFELGVPKPRAVIPIAADLDGSGIDTIVSFLPAERRFAQGLVDLLPADDDRLWPMVVSNPGAPDRLAVFGLDSGSLYLAKSDRPVRLWAHEASLATARHDGFTVVYEVYDVYSHSLSAAAPWYDPLDGVWYFDGTQFLRFPNDPDPPPHTVRTSCADH